MKIRIRTWSATDYSYLVNNTNGWVSDDQKWYEFDDEKDFKLMKKYLCISDGGDLESTDFESEMERIGMIPPLSGHHNSCK